MSIFHSILILRKSYQFRCKSSWIALYFLIYMRVRRQQSSKITSSRFPHLCCFYIKYMAKDMTVPVLTPSSETWPNHVTKDGVTSKIRNKSQL